MIYTKTIGDRQVFSDCRTIQANDGTWISNPTAEQIADAGWVEYIPPVVPPTPQTEPTYDEMLSAVKTMLSSSIEDLSDEEALEIAALYSTWISKVEEAEQKGSGVVAGERLWYNEKLWKVIQPHIPQRDWTPDTAVSLYVEVSIEEWPEIPEIITAENAWMKGEKGTWKGQHYESLIDNNTWNPEAYPAGWKKC